MQKIFNQRLSNFFRIHIHPIFAYFFIGVLFLTLLVYFGQLMQAQEQASLLDFYLITFNDYFFLTYIFHTSLLILFSVTLPKLSVQTYYIVRFDSKSAWFFQTCLSLFYLSFIYIFCLCLLMFLIGVFNLPISAEWSNFAHSYFEITNEQNVISPLQFLFFQLVFFLLFTYIVALCLFVSWIFTQSLLACLIFTMLLHMLGVISMSNSIDFLPVWFPLNQVLHMPMYLDTRTAFTHFAVLILYVIILLILGALRIRRKDLLEKNAEVI